VQLESEESIVGSSLISQSKTLEDKSKSESIALYIGCRTNAESDHCRLTDSSADFVCFLSPPPATTTLRGTLVANILQKGGRSEELNF
jgi:hypothetical protein